MDCMGNATCTAMMSITVVEVLITIGSRLGTHRQPLISIVEDNFDESRYNSWAGSFVQQGLTLLRTQVAELVAQDELNCYCQKKSKLTG